MRSGAKQRQDVTFEHKGSKKNVFRAQGTEHLQNFPCYLFNTLLEYFGIDARFLIFHFVSQTLNSKAIDEKDDGIGGRSLKTLITKINGGKSMSVVSMKQLLEAGVQFGHQTRRWNPKMAPYIYMERNGIYIIDLQKTVRKLEEAYSFIREVGETGGSVLFVGTKKQAQDAIKEEAERVGMFFVNARWLGGMLTNFKTMRMRIDRLAQLRKMQEDGTFDILPKKEVIKLTNEINKLEKYLGGVKEMKKLPAALFIIDPRKERNAIAEARKLGIPIVAIVDTNCDPDEIDYIIPGNDDAIRAIRLISQAIANAVVEGRQGVDMAESETAEASAETEGSDETEAKPPETVQVAETENSAEE